MTKVESYYTRMSSRSLGQIDKTFEPPKPNFFKLGVSSHTEMSEANFKKYCADKKILELDKESFFKIIEFFGFQKNGTAYNEYWTFFALNQIVQKQYGFRYIGYKYYFDWRSNNLSSPEYTYYIRIDRIKKFNYARIKIEF